MRRRTQLKFIRKTYQQSAFMDKGRRETEAQYDARKNSPFGCHPGKVPGNHGLSTIECPFTGVHYVLFRFRRSEERSQQQIRHGPLHVWIQHQTSFAQTSGGQGRPALEASEDPRVGTAREHRLISVFPVSQVIIV